MTLKYYHAEPLANSLKSMAPLKEKGLDYESIYVDLHKFEQHQPWFTAINPEGQVPVLDHDGTIITHTTVINEYLEDVFPDAQPADGPLRPRDAVGTARMRYWNKFVDEQVMNFVSMHGWHRMVGVIARNIDNGEKQLAETPWLAGASYTLADINFYSHCGMMVERMFPEMELAKRAPRLVEWRDRVTARPGMAAALNSEDRTAPGLRTWSGHVR